MSAAATAVTFYSDAAYYGGAERYLTLLARHLDQKRFALSAVLPEDPPVERLETELADAGVRIRRHRRLGFRWWEALTGIRRELEALHGEILHMNLPSTYDAGLSSVALAAKMSGYRRVVATEHLPMIKRRYRRFPAKLFFSEAVDLFLIPAEASREFIVSLHRMPPEKTRVIPLGVEEPPPARAGLVHELKRTTGVGDKTLILGIVGTLTVRKGHRVLIDALSALLGGGGGGDRALPDLKLWVIGEGEDREGLERLVGEKGLGEVVHFLGAMSDAAALMPYFDLLVVPSLVETTPFVVLEAMAASRPVVATRIFGIPEMVDDGVTGYLVPPGDPVALAGALRGLLTDESLRAAFGLAGRARYEAHFTAGRMARDTEAAYLGQEALAAAPAGGEG